MLSLTNQKSNRITSRATVWWLMLMLAVGCRKQAAVEPDVTPPVASSPIAIAPAEDSPIKPFDADLDLLVECLGDRLSLMPAVARYKWEHNLPIEDPARERSLIDRFVAEAQARGLDADWSRRVIAAQIAAARRVQEDCFENWQTSAPDEGDPVRDLQTELRPRIEQSTIQLIEILMRLEPHRKSAAFREIFPSRTDSMVTREAISDKVRHLAITPWLESENRIDLPRKP